jgi:hypothetical protein
MYSFSFHYTQKPRIGGVNGVDAIDDGVSVALLLIKGSLKTVRRGRSIFRSIDQASRELHIQIHVCFLVLNFNPAGENCRPQLERKGLCGDDKECTELAGGDAPMTCHIIPSENEIQKYQNPPFLAASSMSRRARSCKMKR